MTFPVTRQSVVRDLASLDPAARAAAYDALVRSYWRPVYLYVRFRGGRAAADAQDLTQEFFTRAFEREYLERYDAAQARFRTFVRTCLEAFLANERQARSRLKRGGGATLMPIETAEDTACAPPEGADPETWFHREWVRGLFADALAALERRCRDAGHARAFDLFRRYDIDEADATPRLTYAALAQELGLRPTDVTNELAWARRAFREIVLERLRGICASDEEFRAEARDLFGITPR
jgi:RNA polymerase sigma factor (sigma-70 family)